MLNQLGGNCCHVTQDRIIVYYKERGLAQDSADAAELNFKKHRKKRSVYNSNVILIKKNNNKRTHNHYRDLLFSKTKHFHRIPSFLYQYA